MTDYRTAKQIAEDYHVSIHTVRGWLKRKELQFVKAGGRTLITNHAMQEFLAKSTAAASSRAAA